MTSESRWPSPELLPCVYSRDDSFLCVCRGDPTPMCLQGGPHAHVSAEGTPRPCVCRGDPTPVCLLGVTGQEPRGPQD